MDLSNILIKRGNIFHSCKFENIDHCKYFVVMGEDKNRYVGYFFINSNITHSIKKKQDLLDMQMHIKRSDYSFLRYDSFIGANALSYIPKDELTMQLEKRLTTYIGNLTKEDEERLLDSLRRSKLYSAREQKAYFS